MTITQGWSLNARAHGLSTPAQGGIPMWVVSARGGNTSEALGHYILCKICTPLAMQPLLTPGGLVKPVGMMHGAWHELEQMDKGRLPGGRAVAQPDLCKSSSTAPVPSGTPPSRSSSPELSSDYYSIRVPACSFLQPRKEDAPRARYMAAYRAVALRLHLVNSAINGEI